MTFTIQTVARSLADYLSPHLPGVTFYEDPNQQDSVLPCAFLQQRYSYLSFRTGGRWYRRIGLDLTYLEDYNLVDLQRRYQRTAEILDLALETFPYSDGDGSTLLRTYDREWRIDADALHYKFELRVFVSQPEAFHPMEHLTTDITERSESQWQEEPGPHRTKSAPGSTSASALRGSGGPLWASGEPSPSAKP